VKKKKLLGEILIKPIDTTSVSVTASGPWGEEEKEFLYPSTVISGEVATSLEYELGTKFKTKTKKRIIEVVDVAKSYISDFQVGINLEEGFYLKIKREPKKILKIFKESDD
jgi:hypothetical protein